MTNQLNLSKYTIQELLTLDSKIISELENRKKYAYSVIKECNNAINILKNIWPLEEDKQLEREYNQGLSVYLISQIHNRKIKDIKNRIRFIKNK